MKCERCNIEEAECLVLFDDQTVEKLCSSCAVHDERKIVVSTRIKRVELSNWIEKLSDPYGKFGE